MPVGVSAVAQVTTYLFPQELRAASVYRDSLARQIDPPRPGEAHSWRTVELGRVLLISRDCSAIAGYRKRRVPVCAGSSGGLPTPSPPADRSPRSGPGKPAPAHYPYRV